MMVITFIACTSSRDKKQYKIDKLKNILNNKAKVSLEELAELYIKERVFGIDRFDQVYNVDSIRPLFLQQEHMDSFPFQRLNIKENKYECDSYYHLAIDFRMYDKNISSDSPCFESFHHEHVYYTDSLEFIVVNARVEESNCP